jgi:PAS domain S-box-containing protein
MAALQQLAEGVILADKDGRLIFVNSAAEKIHGVKRLMIAPEDYSETYHLLTPQGEPFPSEELPLARAVIDGTAIEDAHWRIVRPDGAVVDAVGTARPILDDAGEQVASVLTLSDRTEEFAAKKALEDALTMKETLLYEVNHRVKNNLALVSALLRLQTKKLTDEAAKAALSDISTRVGVLSDIHGRLYQTGGHTEIEAVSFLAEQVQTNVNVLAAEREVGVKIRAKGSAVMAVDRVVPIALAVNELVLNSIKHAFADTEAPLVEFDLRAENGSLRIVYTDNGKGLDGADKAPRKGIGQALVMNLITQADASMEIGSDSTGRGYRAAMSVPLNTE